MSEKTLVMDKLFEVSYITSDLMYTGKPQLVFKINNLYYLRYEASLLQILQKSKRYVKKYCSPYTYFAYKKAPIMGKIYYGFGNCATLEIRRECIRITLELKESNIALVTLTLSHILEAIYQSFAIDKSSPLYAMQPYWIRFAFSKDLRGCGIRGVVNTAKVNLVGSKEWCELIETEVQNTITETWYLLTRSTIAPKGSCMVFVHDDGHFSLSFEIFPEIKLKAVQTVPSYDFERIPFRSTMSDDLLHSLVLSCGVCKYFELFA